MEACGRYGFSENGEYYGYYSEDGKFRVWDTESAALKQEYTPNLHLSSPCVSLIWFKLSGESSKSSVKIKKSSNAGGGAEHHAVAMGMGSGQILVYSVSKNEVVTTLEGGPPSPVKSLSWIRGSNLYSSAGETILEWVVSKRTIKRKWKGGKHVVTSLLVLPDGKGLLSASKSITLWSLPDAQRIRTFTGHASDVCSLVFIPRSSHSTSSYFISVGKSDRFLSAWSLDSDNQSNVAQFVMEDVALSVSVYSSKSTSMATVTRSGVVHSYTVQLNGKCLKPIKPDVTIRIAAESGPSKSKEPVLSIPIIGGKLCGSSCILIGYGNMPWIKFEKITLDSSEEALNLLRQDPKKAYMQSKPQTSKVMQPEVGKGVQYLNQALEMNVSGTKRSRKLNSEVPMEERLNNLTLNRPETSGNVPRADNTAHLLLQALRSKDKKMIQNALMERDETVIRRTVSRLPVQVILPLVQELTSLMHGKVVRCRTAARWLRIVIVVHASQILANPGATDCLGPIFGIIDTRLNLLNPLLRLRGRLDLLLDQLATAQTGNTESESQEGLLVYQDSYSSEEESLGDEKGESDVDENWDEFSDVEEEEMEKDEADQDDMSVD